MIRGSRVNFWSVNVNFDTSEFLKCDFCEKGFLNAHLGMTRVQRSFKVSNLFHYKLVAKTFDHHVCKCIEQISTNLKVCIASLRSRSQL